uniref:Uncharacterized protein n=1 Tax=viral metagenome TaxID=1070528 RepID=A0A6C0CGU8_9ZZZZ
MKFSGLSSIEFHLFDATDPKATSALGSMAARKTKRDAIVKHDIFIKCAKIEKVPFWIAFFENCAIGKFSKGLSYKDGALHFKKLRRKVIQKVDIPQDPVLAIEVVKEFVRKEMQTMSNDELMKKRIEMGVALERNAVSSSVQWKDIRAPTVRQQMINIYAWEHVENGCITFAEANNFVSVVNMGLATGAITGQDITLVNGRIVEIEGLGHDENEFYLLRENSASRSIPSKTVEKTSQIAGYKNWDKLDAQYTNYIHSGFSVK